MPDVPTEQTPVETPAWEVTKDGRLIIEGSDVTDFINPDWEPPKEEEPPANPDNAQVEGKEAEAEEVKEEPPKEPEPEKEEAKEPEPEPEPEKPKEPEKLKFKLKFRGNEQDVEYDPAQIQTRLNKLRAFEENEREFWERNKKLEPYMPFLENGWLEQKVREAYETGELEKPPAPPAIPSVVQYELAKRQAEPDHDEVLTALREYAIRLPLPAQRLLDSDPTVFLPEYDRIAKEMREAKVTPPPAPPKPTADELRKKLEHKETAKKAAVVSSPGVAHEPVSPAKEWAAKEKELRKQLRDPSLAHRNLEIAAELLLHIENKPSG